MTLLVAVDDMVGTGEGVKVAVAEIVLSTAVGVGGTTVRDDRPRHSTNPSTNAARATPITPIPFRSRS